VRQVVRIGLVVLLLPLATSHAEAQPAAALDPAALATLRRMADHLRGLPSLRVEAQVEHDALQRDGQTIEFGSTREIAVRRPDRIRAEATDRSGAQRSLTYDGRRVTVLDRAQAVYATAEQTGDVDAILRFAEEQLGVPVPLGELLSSELGERLDEELVFAAVVGAETLDGVRCDHLALRNADRGIQIWVEQGETPLPRRISITWEQAPGRPQFRARLTKWELSPRLPDALFAFEPPEGAERIPFHVPAAPPAGGG
jgi:hypothetical protein